MALRMPHVVCSARRVVRAIVATGLVTVTTVGTTSSAEPAGAAGASYQAMTPVRVLDTRIALGTTTTVLTKPGVPIPNYQPKSAPSSLPVALTPK